MRELKFRYIWNGKWYYIDLYLDNTGLRFTEFEKRVKTSRFFQYTEFKDKNGVEIYDASIVLFDGQKYEVCMNDFMKQFVIDNDSGQTELFKVYMQCEVTGDTYDN